MVTCLLTVLGLAAPARGDSQPRPSTEPEGQWGLGGQARRTIVGRPFQEIFVDDTPGRAEFDGFGIDFAYRKGKVEFVLGLGYDPLKGRDGYYLEKGGDPLMPGTVDYVEFRQLKWFTVEASVVGYGQLHPVLALRYGAGLGVGVLRGQVRKTDALCTSRAIWRDCTLDLNGVEVDKVADIPPVLPIVNAFVGIEVRPVRHLALHLDGGIHTFPYVGAGATLYLW